MPVSLWARIFYVLFVDVVFLSAECIDFLLRVRVMLVRVWICRSF